VSRFLSATFPLGVPAPFETWTCFTMDGLDLPNPDGVMQARIVIPVDLWGIA